MIGLSDEGGSEPPLPSRIREFAASIFAEGGVLQSGLGLEHRPQQEEMALAVAAAFRDDASLLFEAGTGVGKSLAYLLPGIIHAVDAKRQMIVSTNTISLQEQLEAMDLPICRRLFKAGPDLEKYAGFKAAVLVGKSNYLCTTRLSHALADRASLFAEEDYAELQRIAAWAETSSTGLRHELNPPPRPDVWEAVSADSSSCARKYCDGEHCFYQRTRARIREADVIILNHALLFALINAGGPRAQGGGADARGILFPDDFLVLDEAHTVPEVATAHFGLSLSSYGVERSLKFLFNARTKRGLLRKFGSPETQRLVADALEASRVFFDSIGTGLLASRPVVRLREANPSAVPPNIALESLERAIGKAADKLEDGRERDELLEQRLRMGAIRAGITEWLTLGDENHVYWAERGGRKQTIVSLRSAPIDVAPELAARVFGAGVGVLCTSATLAAGEDMGPFSARVGAGDARTVVVRSPFDFERNMKVYVAADVPLPSPQEAKLALDVLADYIRFCALRVPGGSLVLFTSHGDMRTVAAGLREAFHEAGRPLLLQGEGLDRTELTRRMRSLGNAILFGTDSFWTGVDVPGDALAQVIITRLPFDPPTHPVTEAQAERIRDNGGNPFNELTLPDALIKFRQGVGRLIRSQSDRGAITILDSRVLAKMYGRHFIEGLPKRDFVRLTRENRDAEFNP